MSATREPPLDEVQWRSPQIAHSMGGVHSNSVLHYFGNSPFFDVTSNNATLTTQANYNAAMYHIVQTREAFEGRLRTMQGLEFMVAHEPTSLASSSQPARQGAHIPPDQRSGIWVIHKQYRRKVPGADDQITVLGVYFVVGENIYMAPSVANVLGSRLLSTVASLTKYLSTVSTLPIFSPALGNVYIRPMPKPPTAATAQTRSRSSKESTPALEGSQQGGVTSVSSARSRMDSTQESRMLAESFNMTLRHESEYMDDNPLVGEPGSFILSSSNRGTAQAGAAAIQPKAVVAAKTAVSVGRERTASPAASSNDVPIAATAATAAGSPMAGKGGPVGAVGDATAGNGKEADRTSPTNAVDPGTDAFMAGSKAKRGKSRASSATMPSGLMSG